MLTAMERDQFNEKKSNRLRDFILDDQQLLVELIESADIEVIKDLTRALQLSPAFDDMDKRSAAGTDCEELPSIQSLISGEHGQERLPGRLPGRALERRRSEYNELVQKKIPANSKDIAIARSYGDLRENHEYKAAKETHKLLMRARPSWRTKLARSRGTDFANPRTDCGKHGNQVTVHRPGHAARRSTSSSALGISTPTGISLSYLMSIGQSMVGKKVGEEVEFELEGTRKHFGSMPSTLPGGLNPIVPESGLSGARAPAP